MFETTYQHINSYKMYHDMNGYDNIMIKLDPPFAAMKMSHENGGLPNTFI